VPATRRSPHDPTFTALIGAHAVHMPSRSSTGLRTRSTCLLLAVRLLAARPPARCRPPPAARPTPACRSRKARRSLIAPAAAQPPARRPFRLPACYRAPPDRVRSPPPSTVPAVVTAPHRAFARRRIPSPLMRFSTRTPPDSLLYAYKNQICIYIYYNVGIDRHLPAGADAVGGARSVDCAHSGRCAQRAVRAAGDARSMHGARRLRAVHNGQRPQGAGRGGVEKVGAGRG
jgi:hypothetical protein